LNPYSSRLLRNNRNSHAYSHFTRLETPVYGRESVSPPSRVYHTYDELTNYITKPTIAL
jgi:hypothetical protein